MCVAGEVGLERKQRERETERKGYRVWEVSGEGRGRKVRGGNPAIREGTGRN